jgi:peptidoglycan hydrolase-like protein with peptidoglycan-binding domain
MRALYHNNAARTRVSQRGGPMKKLISTVLSLLMVTSIGLAGQNANSSSTGSSAAKTTKKRGPVFRANKDQVKQAQAILKQRGFYTGDETGKLDPGTREGLKKYQTAETLKVTGTLNKLTLEKMGITLTEKQRVM